MSKPSASQFRFIGLPLVRKEDARLVTGKGHFSDDFSAAGQCYLAMVRSPNPYAHIRRIDFFSGAGDARRSRDPQRRRLPCRRASSPSAQSAAEDAV
jgi:hypothetical protein